MKIPDTISPNLWYSATSMPREYAIKCLRVYLGRMLFPEELQALNDHYNYQENTQQT